MHKAENMASAEETNQKKFSNWLQSVQALEDTKAALGQHVLDIWKKRLMKWKENADLKSAIPTFLRCVAANNVKYMKKKWCCDCTHVYCATVLKDLLSLQQNPGSSIVWNSSLCEKVESWCLDVQLQADIHTDTRGNIIRSTLTNMYCFLEYIVRVFQVSNEERNDTVSFEDIFEGCTEGHVWCIANMFMQRGKGKTNIQNTGPDDTDAAMFFRMMKNCKLFEIEDDNHLYDDILLCRDRLHHSANNRIHHEEAESHLKTMTTLLKKFDDVPKCKNVIENIEKICKETIVCISMPDVNIREMAKKVFSIKKSALQVDIEIDKDKGFKDDDKNDLLTETLTELENAKDPEKALNEVKSRAEYKQELEEKEKTIKKFQQQNEANKLQRRNNPREDKAVQEEKKIVFQSRRVKDFKKRFEGLMNLLQKSLNNPKVADCIEQKVNRFLEDTVEELSSNDVEFRTKAKEFAREEDTNDDITCGTSSALKQKYLSSLQLLAEKIKPVPDVRCPHLWSVASKYTYDISVEKEKDCHITGSCQLPSGQSLLVDCNNRRLKKLDTSYKVRSSCRFEVKPWDVCYIGNDEAVVSVPENLTFVDVVSMTVIRSVNIKHSPEGLAFHGNLLYIANKASVYEYSTNGIKQHDLYTVDEVDICPESSIAVSDDGSKIYILHDKKLTAIDNSGKHLYTFEKRLNCLCVDGEGNVLACETSSGNILQIKFNGTSQRITASENNISTKSVKTLSFDRQRSRLICGGNSNTLTILQLS